MPIVIVQHLASGFMRRFARWLGEHCTLKGMVRAEGGRVLARDRDSSVAFGMPCGAIEARLSHDVLPIDAIADRILGPVLQKDQR